VRRYLAESMVPITASIVVMLGMVALGGSTLRQAPLVPELSLKMMPGCFDTPVAQVGGSGIAGQAQICITDDAVRPALRVANLTPDTAYLALFEYFEEPAACQGFPCTTADLRADGSGGTLARLDATVANGTRRADFNGDFRDVPFTRRSQITLTLFDRGSVRGSDGRHRAHQLLALPISQPGGAQGGYRADPGAGHRVAQAVFLPIAEEHP
jgi:hypothetical protein